MKSDKISFKNWEKVGRRIVANVDIFMKMVQIEIILFWNLLQNLQIILTKLKLSTWLHSRES